MDPSDVWLPLAEALLGKATFSPLDVAREAGLEPEEARRLWRALGFPPVADEERAFTRSDIEIVRAVRALIEIQGVHPDDVIQLTRVIGQAVARVADAQVTVTADRLTQLHDATADRAPGEAAAFADLLGRIETLAPMLEQFLGYVWRRHLLAALRRYSAMPSAGDRSLAVGFADLVGFTAMSEALSSRELAQMVDRFEAVAYEHIPEYGGRVVKMIGDEVMFAAEDPAIAAEIGLALAEGYARETELSGVRVGLACGPTLTWEGDLFGPTVNLASRLVNLARPNTVLAGEDLGRQLRDDARFDLRHLRPLNLRGIGRVRMWVLRRATEPKPAREVSGDRRRP